MEQGSGTYNFNPATYKAYRVVTITRHITVERPTGAEPLWHRPYVMLDARGASADQCPRVPAGIFIKYMKT